MKASRSSPASARVAAGVRSGPVSHQDLFGLFAGLRRANELAASRCSLLLSASLESVPEEYLQRALDDATELAGHAQLVMDFVGAELLRVRHGWTRPNPE